MRTNSYRHLSAEDRETVSVGLAHGHSLRRIASLLGRAPSTVSRELKRTTTRGHPYRACTAQTRATARARQPRRPRKLLDPWLWEYVRTHLAEGCSPEQIAGRLRRAYPDEMRKQLSTETTYAGLYVLPAVLCAVHYWPHCGRHATRVGLGREKQTVVAKFRI